MQVRVRFTQAQLDEVLIRTIRGESIAEITAALGRSKEWLYKMKADPIYKERRKTIVGHIETMLSYIPNHPELEEKEKKS